MVERIAITCCPVIDFSHLNEFVLNSPFIIVPVAPVLLSIREGDILASVHPECSVSSVPALQDSLVFLLALVGSGSQPVRGLVLLDCRLPSGIYLYCSGLCVGSIPRDSASRVPARWLVLASLGAMSIKSIQGLLSLCHSLGIVIKKEFRSRTLGACNLSRCLLRFRARQIFPTLVWVGCWMATLWCCLSVSTSTSIWFSARAVLCSGRSPQPSGSGYRVSVVFPPPVATALLRSWAFPSFDLFATGLPAVLPLFCSLVPNHRVVFLDAYRVHWATLGL